MIHCQPLHGGDGANHNSAAAIGPALMSVILTSGFHGSKHAANDLSHAYAGVFVVAMILVAAIAIPRRCHRRGPRAVRIDAPDP